RRGSWRQSPDGMDGRGRVADSALWPARCGHAARSRKERRLHAWNFPRRLTFMERAAELVTVGAGPRAGPGRTRGSAPTTPIFNALMEDSACLRAWRPGRADIDRYDPQQPDRVGLRHEVGGAELGELVATLLIIVHPEHHDGHIGVPAS